MQDIEETKNDMTVTQTQGQTDVDDINAQVSQMVGKSPKKKRVYSQTGFDDFPSIEAFNLMDRDHQELTRRILINFASDYYPQTDTWY